jgi:LAO/AO transport system kinase
VRTVASQEQGIEGCAQAIESYRAFLETSSFRKKRSVEIQRDRLLEVIRSQVLLNMMRQSGIRERLEALALEIAERRTDPFSAADELLRSCK